MIRHLLLGAVVVALTTTVQARPDESDRAPDNAIPGQWIVTLEAAPSAAFTGGAVTDRSGGREATVEMAATAPEATGQRRLDVNGSAVRAYADFLDAQRDAVLAEAAGLLGRSVSPRHVYRHAFNGFSVRLDEAGAEQLARIPGVRSVEPDTHHAPALDAGPQHAGANAVWNGFGGIPATRGEGTVIGIIDTGINWDHPYFSDDPNFSGGHNYSNPFGNTLGLCGTFGVECNDKLVGVYDFTDEGTHGFDPGGHGSHVASIAAGNPLNFTIEMSGSTLEFDTSGMAPWANLVSYKVCYEEHPDNPDLDGLCEHSAMLDAIDQAVTDGVDVVNHSIGGQPQSPWSSNIATAYRNLRNAGILPVSSAGNENAGEDLETVADPAGAPWVVGVANFSHDRLIGGSADVAGLQDLTTSLGTGPSVNSDLSAEVVDVADLDGNGLGCTGYDAGALNGAIAFIQRGSCTFEVKVNHADDAGAEGVIVYNHISGPPITMGGLEQTALPAVMIGNSDGVMARDAIADAGSPQATIFQGSSLSMDSEWADVVSDSSSWGPYQDQPGIMKPDLGAPGTSIIGAYVPDENSINFLSGTSMASPHVAGAAALLASIRPDWEVWALHSALVTTATADPVTINGEPAPVVARGAGRLRVDEAARAGLALRETGSDFANADPDSGGDPGALNLPGLFGDCTGSCTFTRQVRALQDGSWTVSTEGDLDIDVDPSSFSLSAGQSRQLTVTVSRGDAATGGWRDGSVVLAPDSGSLSTQRLTVGAFISAGSVPGARFITVDNNRGEASLTMPDVGLLPEAVFRTSPLVRPEEVSLSLDQDPSNNDPFSGGPGTDFMLVDVPPETLLLYAETLQSASDDIDLFVGRDDNGNGEPDLEEMVCQSISPDELEECEIETPTTGEWWVLFQNFTASSPGASDFLRAEMAVLTVGDDPSLVTYGPGRHDGGSLSLPLYWDQPAMEMDQRWLGAVGTSATPDDLANVGITRVEITRDEDNAPRNTVLFNGEEYPVVVPGNTSHDRLYIDVPQGTESLEVDIAGPQIDASLRFLDFEDIAGSEPDTPPAPDNFIDSATNSGDGLSLSVPGTGVPAGRYYVVLENSIGSEAMVTVTANFQESQRNELVRGLYSPRNRSTGQGIEWNGNADDDAYILWYTYDDDGVPVFYITDVKDQAADSSFWSTDILRATTGDDQRQTLLGVGKAGVTALDSENLIYSWRYNGRHGSEWLDLVTDNRCAEIDGQSQHLLATWTIQGAREGGASVLINDSSEAWIRYYFDAVGVGRWLEHASVDETPPNTGSHDTAVNEMSVLDYRGFCPYCEDTGFGYEVVGSVEREFFDELSGMETLEFTSRPPLNQEYSATRTMGRLSQVLGCQ